MPQLSIVGYEPLTPDVRASGAPDIPGLLDQKADQYGVPRNLVRTVAKIESNFKPGAFSPKGAIGVMQLMPSTARALGVDPSDPEQNADGGVRLLSQLIDKYGGDTRRVLAAYNAGEPAVDRAGGVPNYRETQRYVSKGLKDLPPNLSTGAGAPTTPAPASGGKPASEDLFSRIASGNITPDVLEEIMRPQQAQPSAAAPTPQAAPATRPAVTITNFEPYQSASPASVTDALKHEDFLHSAWNALISPFTATKSILSGEYSQVTHQQLQQAAQLQKSGTPEEKRAFARDVLLQNIPFASTLYKAFQGNLPGAAGDVAGFAALPIAAKALPAAAGAIKTGAGIAADVARSPLAADVVGVVSPRAANALRVTGRGLKTIDAVKQVIADARAKAATTPAAATAPEAAAPGVTLTPEQARMVKTAQAAKWTPEQQAMADTILQNVEPNPPTTPPAAPQAAPAAPEAPAATQEPAAAPVVPEAPQTLQPAASVEKLTDIMREKKIPPHMIDRLPGEYWQFFADEAGTAVPTADEIAQIKQNVAAKTVETPAQGEQVFQTQKAKIEEGMTPLAAPSAGVVLQPLPPEIPPHYSRIQAADSTMAATRAFHKDLRISDYLLGKGITPEEFEAMPLEQQNTLIREAPAASKKGKHLPFLPKPEGAATKAVGRWAEEGVKDIADTMRWRQAQTPAAPEAAAMPPEAAQMAPAEAEAAFQAEKAKPAPAKRTQAAPVKPPAAMSAAEINRRLDQLDKKSSQLNDRMLAEGRGQERPSEYAKKTDPLSSELNAVHSELSDLRNEIARRYGPGAPSRLPRGFGPIK